MKSLPPITAVDGSHLPSVLSMLLEPSDILFSTLSPGLAASGKRFASYTELIDAAIAQVANWDPSLRAQFIAGHPRIGETKNLSPLSAKEQGATPVVAPTPPQVLTRLAHLNASYERRYPGLRYITFVNGRSRAAIAVEMEDALGLAHSLSQDQPPVEEITPIEPDTDAWRIELDRAVVDVGRIAKGRLSTMKIEESRCVCVFIFIIQLQKSFRSG
ncbi:Oxo-4-hydroxy-4-carboxy-5-ureidoimidazoline decarboxylase [Mycena maculata]|uniref:Oxo-4-hydroxy-4-carboxy-5-ureidoimidazoline decarboxylase n=1 Tax=Mycena maculata TaxID=230809 RepID=A0AAD7IQC7_9AGAR|nr:Oxo-4-hydroxy-4-carboxy-5-ureidoimidazoline decarboxylase [Mycena maculata]